MKTTIEVPIGNPKTEEVFLTFEVEADMFGPWAVHGKIDTLMGEPMPRGHWVLTHAKSGRALAETGRKVDAVDLARRLNSEGLDPWPEPTDEDRETWSRVRKRWASDRSLHYEEPAPWSALGKWYPTEDSPR